MFQSLSPVYKGITLALIGYSGFAISDASAKFLTGGYAPLTIISFIMVAAWVILLLISPMLGGITRPARAAMKFHALRTVMNFCVSILIVYAFASMPLTTAYAIVFAMPFIAALLAIPLYKERVTRSRWVAIGLGFCGVLVAMRPSADGIDLNLLLPFGAAICAAVMWISARSLQGESIFSMGFYPVFGSWLLSLPFIAFDFQLPALSDIPFFLICGFGICAGVIGLSLAFRSAPSAAVSPFHYTQMIWGLVFGYFIFNDVPDMPTMIGGCIIIASGLFLIFSERKKT